MCDYSLELYQSRAAKAGERLVTKRFPSSSMGMIAPNVPGCAVCIQDGTVLSLDLSSPDLTTFRDRHGFAATEVCNFVRRDSDVYRDGLRFENGVELSLQQVPPGVTVEVARVVALPIDGALEATEGPLVPAE